MPIKLDHPSHNQAMEKHVKVVTKLVEYGKKDALVCQIPKSHDR